VAGEKAGLALPAVESDVYRLVRLANGAWSVRSERYAETFHPVVGPAAEAEALYIRQLRLRERVAASRDPFVIWDVGLGAAGNALAVLAATADLPCPIEMISFDRTLEPLEFALRHATRFPDLRRYESAARALARTGAREVELETEGRKVTWRLVLGDFPSWAESDAAQAVPKPHAILFDAFSPASNPEMWTLPLFGRIFGLLDPARPCALPTYSRSTLLRVTLLLAGFHVGRGHATGEKDETTIAANDPVLLDDPLDRGWLSRACRSTSAEPLREPVYRQAPLSSESRDRLERHPQFACP
jgi:tRNA U34 5-methylaminomethyl-2-thiouridine-forming methyltransferase MnmC